MISGIIIGVLTALIANEFSDFSPSLAARLVRLSARQAFPDDPQRANDRAEELQADVRAIPGKMCQLLYGLGFGAAGLWQWTDRRYRARHARFRFALAKYLALMAPSLMDLLCNLLGLVIAVVGWSLSLYGFVAVLECLEWMHKVNPMFPYVSVTVTLGLGLIAGFWIHHKQLRRRRTTAQAPAA